MPKAARLSDPAAHLMKPMGPGAASANVKIGNMKAWRALPAGLGAGIESALDTMKQLMDAPTLNPVTTPAKLAQAFAGLMQDAAKAAPKGSPSAPGKTAGEFSKLMATNVKETATYTSAAAVPGGQPAAIAAYTLAMKQAAADFASAAVGAIAGMTDTHVCPQPSGPIPHGPGVVTKGSKSVFINGLPACRQGDKLFEAAGGANPIAQGCTTVIIGDDGGSAGSPGSGADQATVADAAALAEQVARAPSSAAALAAAAWHIEAATSLTQIRPAARGLKHRVAFQVVIDQTGEPVPGVYLQITLPDGRTETHATDADGQVEINDLKAPGLCSVSCSNNDARLATTYDFVALGEVRCTPPGDLYEVAPPARHERPGGIPPRRAFGIAEIEQHQVETGETLESVARQAGMTWQQLALFNWNTADPNEINRYLREDVGCRRTTRDGRNYVFDSADDPGIVYVPRPWGQSGLATDQVHTFRVQALGFGPSVRRIRLFDGFARAIPGAPYAVEIDGREVSRGLADENGDITLANVTASVCTVKWSCTEHVLPAAEPIAGDSSDEEGAMFVRDWEFDYTRDIFVELDSRTSGENVVTHDSARKRLSNMGYCAGHTLAENVRAFQRDSEQIMTGVLEDAMSCLRDHHDNRCQPPEGCALTRGQDSQGR